MLDRVHRCEVIDARNRRDPTKTVQLRARFRAEGDRRWQVLARTLRQALIERDLVGLRGMHHLPSTDKTEGFGLWLAEELRQKVLGIDGRWMWPFVQLAAAAAQVQVDDGTVDPARVTSMQSLAVSELKGIIAAAQQQIVRAVTQCLMASVSPTRCANAVAGVIKTMRQRTRAMAEYIVVKTHATSTLSALRSAGVTHVGVDPERIKRTAHGKVLVDGDDPGHPFHGNQYVRSGHQGNKLQKESGGSTIRYRVMHPVHGEVGIVEKLFSHEGEGWRVRQHGGNSGRIYPTFKEAKEEAGYIRKHGVYDRDIEEGEDVDVITAGDNDVCPACEEISLDGPYELDEAEGLIPAHNWCRCKFVPLSDRRFAQVERDAAFDFDPSEPRDPHGRWTFAGGPQGEKWQDLADQVVKEWRAEHPRVAAKTVELRRDLDQMMRETEQFASFKDWYDEHRPLAKEFFGEDEPLFEKMLSAGSIQAGGSVNVNRAIDAYAHFKLGGSFEAGQYGDLPAVRQQLEKLAKGEELSGEKIGPFAKALTGDWDQVPADRWMKRLLFAHPQESGGSWQNDVTQAVVTAMAHRMGWKPAQLQAAQWALAKSRAKGLGGDIFTYKEFLEKQETRIRALMHTVRAFSDAVDAVDVNLLSKLADAYRDARLLLMYLHEVSKGELKPLHDFNPYHEPAGSFEGGRFASAAGGSGYEFVSPSVEVGGQLPDALLGLSSGRQKVLRNASVDIDNKLGMTATHTNAVGAWSDGAENSIISVVSGNPTWDQLKTSAAMEGHIADQKAVLIFKQQDDGDATLYNFHVKENNIEKLHKNLIDDGVAFHTIAPSGHGEADVYVADLDGTAHDAVAKAAERYDVQVTYQTGRAEFIGSVKQDGTDQEQRDDAHRAYEEVIRQSQIPGSAEIWSGVRDYWGKALEQRHKQPFVPFAEREALQAKLEREAEWTKYTREVDTLRDPSVPIDWQQRQALEMYTNSPGFFQTENHLPLKSAEADRLNALAKQFKAPRDLVLYRTVGWSFWNEKLKANVGKDFTDPNFLSTTIDPGLSFRPGSYIEIKVPKGTPMLPIGSLSNHPNEAEVMLPRETRMRIESAEEMSTPNSMKFKARIVS